MDVFQKVAGNNYFAINNESKMPVNANTPMNNNPAAVKNNLNAAAGNPKKKKAIKYALIGLGVLGAAGMGVYFLKHRKALNGNDIKTMAQNAKLNRQISEVASAATGDSRKIEIIQNEAMEALDTVAKAELKIKQSADEITAEAAVQAQKITDEAQDFAKNIQQKAKKLFDEVSDLFKKGEAKTDDGKIIRQITDATEAGQRKMLEYDPSDGKTLLRETEFLADSPTAIIEHLKDGTENVLMFDTKNGNLIRCQQGAKKFPDGAFECDIMAAFENNKISKYQKTLTVASDGKQKIGTFAEFQNDKLHHYQKGFKTLDGGIWSRDSYAEFNDGILEYFEKGLINQGDLKLKQDIMAEFENGIITKYEAGFNTFDDMQELKSLAKLDDGKLSLYKEGIKTYKDGRKERDFAGWLKDGKLKQVEKNYLETSQSEKLASSFGFEDDKVVIYENGIEHFSDGSELRDLLAEFKDGKWIFNITAE